MKTQGTVEVRRSGFPNPMEPEPSVSIPNNRNKVRSTTCQVYRGQNDDQVSLDDSRKGSEVIVIVRNRSGFLQECSCLLGNSTQVLKWSVLEISNS